MITSFRVRNLRSIRDSSDIELAKITVLVGKNSAGKSTLLRVLPLIRQSSERPTKGPLLWYGQFVDFGTFKNAVNVHNPKDGVTIEFQLSIDGNIGKKNTDELDYFDIIESTSFYSDLNDVRIRLTIGQNEADESGKARSITLNTGSDDLTVHFGESGHGENTTVVLNGRLISLPETKRWARRPGKIIPIPVLLKESHFETNGKRHVYHVKDQRPFSEELAEKASILLMEGLRSEKPGELLDRLLYASKEGFYKQIVKLLKFSPDLSRIIKDYKPGDAFISSLRELTLLSNISGILNRIDNEIASFAGNVRYIEPLRATAERYYRLQDLAVDEIDSRGENTAMFLNSLSYIETLRLRQWMRKSLGFHAHVTSESGHVQVFINDSEGNDKNIADLGFGYSQLLPIILQIWRAQYSRNAITGRSRPIIAIEQPELHLHPQFQAQMADVIAGVAQADEEGPSIFLETESPRVF